MEHMKCVLSGGIAYSLVTISIDLPMYIQNVPLRPACLHGKIKKAGKL
jgi:hypothetical protein